MIFEENLFTTAVSIPKSFHLAPFLPTFEIHKPTLLCYTWSHLYSSSSPLLQTQDRIEHFRLNKVVLLLPFIEIELAAFLPGTSSSNSNTVKM